MQDFSEDEEQWFRSAIEYDLSERYRRMEKTLTMLPTEEDKLGYLHNSLASAELLILPKALNLITGSEYTELVRREGDMIQSIEAFKRSIIFQIKKLRTPQSYEEETPDSLDKTVLLRLCTNREMEKVERFMVKMHG